MKKRNNTMKLWHGILVGGILTVLSFIVLTGVLGWWFTQPVAPYNKETVQFVVPQGSSVQAIGRLLEDKSLIRSRYAFQAVVVYKGLTKKMQAGAFMLSPSQNLFALSDTLTSGTNDVWVTIKEGLRAEEIGEILAKNLPEFDRDGEDYQTECLAYEGYLFPETYLVPVTYDTKQTCKLLRGQYGDQVTMKLRETMHAGGRTEEEVITMASIVAREAKSASDMKMVAGILWNRIELGMPLQVDATLQYAKGYDKANNTWWPTPLSADKEIPSKYNTYKNAGLPPGPISNPGLSAIEAATTPTPNDFIYYISNSDGSKMYFAKTYDEHLSNIEKHLR
jgi:UPF0755 protein